MLGGTPRRILTGIDSHITFSPDGRQLAYLRADYPEPGASVLMVANADGTAEAREPQIWTMDADGGTRRQLTTDGWNAWARPSPDGRAIVAFSSRGDAPGLWLMDADGGRARELTRLAGVVDPTMTPDGRWVVFTSAAAGSESAMRYRWRAERLKSWRT